MAGINFETIKNAFASFLGKSEGENAIDMLIEDHRRVKQICEAYKDMEDDEKVESVHKVLVELALHAAVEEQLVYPLLGEVGERDCMNESKEEHHVIKFLMSELEIMHEADERLDAKFKVLSEIVDHHVQEEELEYFPKLRGKEDIDLQALGEQIAQRKEELLQKLGDESDLSVIDPELRAHRNGDDRGSADGDRPTNSSGADLDELSKKRSATSGRSREKSTAIKKNTSKPAVAATKAKPKAPAKSAKKDAGKPGKKIAAAKSKAGTKKVKLDEPKTKKKAILSKAKPVKKAVSKKAASTKATTRKSASVRTKPKATQEKAKSARGKRNRAA